LGRLEELAVQMAAWQGEALPQALPAAVIVFATDHPVTRHRVSPYPSEVTRAMLSNFLSGGAAASVLCRSLKLPLRVVDVGVDGGQSLAPFGSESGPAGVTLRRDAVANLRAGDIRVEDALDAPSFAACVEAGRRAVRELVETPRVLLLGEMGIGNTTPAAAVCAALLSSKDAGELVGAGTGASGELLERKRQVVRDAIARIGDGAAPLEILRRLGGRDLAALFGAMLQGLEQRALILIDGFIVSAAALALYSLSPGVLRGMIFSHVSNEKGHARVLRRLGVSPLCDLQLRLGEASGALIAFPILKQACELHAHMATFESAGVPNRAEDT
jgi:nicotinate-nucleotide--dimethylbenzimidazole phosphoribosyltransferase